MDSDEDSYSPPLYTEDLPSEDSYDTQSEQASAGSPVLSDYLTINHESLAPLSQPCRGGDALPLLKLANWKREQNYIKDPPECTRYRIQ
jgi:hypothetical protein